MHRVNQLSTMARKRKQTKWLAEQSSELWQVYRFTLGHEAVQAAILENTGLSLNACVRHCDAFTCLTWEKKNPNILILIIRIREQRSGELCCFPKHSIASAAWNLSFTKGIFLKTNSNQGDAAGPERLKGEWRRQCGLLSGMSKVSCGRCRAVWKQDCYHGADRRWC